MFNRDKNMKECKKPKERETRKRKKANRDLMRKDDDKEGKRRKIRSDERR